MRKRDGLFKLLGLCLLAGVLVAGLLFPAVGGLGLLSNQASATVEQTSSDLVRKPPPLVTTLTDSQGSPIATLYDQYRIPISAEDISPAMKWAIISIEDRRFYEHNGVDWKGTLRAAINNQVSSDLQGASTLTQQYVKNYLINVVYRNNEAGQQRAQASTIARKLREARIAIELETKMTKQEVLAGYLNMVEFSRQIYGVGAAANAYFNTTPDKLNVPQAALLAGMVNNPGMLDPWNHPEAATQRRNVVIDEMVNNEKLSPEAAAEAKKAPLGVLPGGPQKPSSNCISAGSENGFFCKYVVNYLERHGISKEQLAIGGYTIKTTMDQAANHAAKVSAEKQVKQTQDNVANTLSLVRPGKERHEVVALAANRDFGTVASEGQTVYPLPSGVTNVTGAGSSYKIFTAAATLQQGVAGIYDTIQSPSFHASDVFISSQPNCPQIDQYGTAKYCLTNATDDYPPTMSLQTALATSPNTAFVILEEKAGMGAVVDMASKLGMRRTMAANISGGKPDPNSENLGLRQTQTEFFGPTNGNPGQGSFTLGVSATSGLELANVAATIMSGGVWCPPTPIGKIVDRNGDQVKINEEPCEQAVPEGLANTLAAGMSKDIEPGGTASGARPDGWNRPMIGKTGTTEVNGSAAFVGAVPQMAGAAMVFRPDHPNGGLRYNGVGNVVPVPIDSGNMFGGKTPAQTWFGAMQPIMEGKEVIPLPGPAPKYEHMN